MLSNRIVRGIPLALALLVVAQAGLPAGAAEERLFDYRETTLDNGLRVLTMEDFSTPIVAVHLWYHVGSKDENPERQGFAHMFEHMMFRGTDKLGPTDHFDYIRRTGGDCNAYTSFDNTTYIQTLPANQLDLALWLEAERMSFLKIDQEAFDTERKVVEEERRLGLNRPYGTILEKLFAEIFKVHPYRWTPIGNIPALRSSEVKELREFWTRYYIPNNATLVIVGAVKHEDAQAAARKYFGWIPRYPDPPRVTAREPEPTEARSITLKEDNAPTPLVGVLFRGVSVADKDFYKLELLTTILGGGESSRLYRELVADKELAVMAAAGAFSLEQEGLIGAGAALSPLGGDSDKVLAAMQAQIERLRTEPVTEHELTKARNQLLRNIVTENLTVVSKASALGSAAVLEGDARRVNTRLDEIRAITADDLLATAKKYLAPERAIKGKVERNLMGMIFGKKNAEEEAPITAKPETDPPAPGRPGVERPADFPRQAPVAGMLDYDPTLRYEERKLSNGLRVMVVQNHEVPFVTVELGLLNGAWTEEKPGTASMALSMLTKGTQKHDEGQLADELETYAISLSGDAGMDSASVSASALTEHVERAVNLMAEAVLTPTFPATEFKKLRKQVVTGLTVSSSEPGYIAERELRKQLYGTHPYARTATGEIEDVNALQVDDLSRWWARFARPDQAVMIFAGDIDMDRASKLAETAFAAWKPEGAPPQVALPDIPQLGKTQIFLVDRPGVQSQIRVATRGMLRTDPSYFVGRVMSGYFGGAFSSRLMETIRVKKGLTYGAGGGFSAQRFSGDFRISTFSKTESTVEAVQAILEEIERLRTEAPTQKELDNTKSYMVGSFASDRETPQQVADDLWLLELNELPRDYYESMLKTTAQTTAEACVELAKSKVDPAKLVIVVVGPAKALQTDLEKIAPVTVVKPSAADSEDKRPAAQ